MGRTLDAKDLQMISLFEGLSRAKILDCMQTKSRVMMVVRPGDMGLAIGKKGENVKKLEKMTGKKIELIEYSDNPAVFVENILAPLKADIELKDGKIRIEADYKTRGRILGRGKNVLKKIESFLERHNQNYSVEVR